MKVYTYQSHFYVPQPPAAAPQTTPPFFEAGGTQQPWRSTDNIFAKGAAASGKSQFVASSLAPMGWEIQPWQPPHPRPEKAAALIGGDPGQQAPQIRFTAPGWEVQSWQPPHPRPEKAAALARGDDGTQGQFTATAAFAEGWQIQPWQPPHPRPERAGGLMRGLDGTDAAYVNWRNTGWEIQSVQPPHPRPEKGGLLPFGTDGLRELIIAVTVPAGWDNPYVAVRQPPKVASALASKNQFASFTLSPIGWEVQSPQPPHPRPEKAGAIMVGDGGIVARFVPPVVVSWGYEPPTTQPRFRFNAPPTGPDTVYPLGRVTAWGYEPPQHLRTRRNVPAFDIESIFAPRAQVAWGYEPPVTQLRPLRRLPNIDSETIYPLRAFSPWGYEPPAFQPARQLARRSATRGKADFAIFAAFADFGFDVQTPHLPRIQRRLLVDAALPLFTATTLIPAFWGHEMPLTWVPRRPRGAAIFGRSQFASFALPPMGWEVQPWQPPHPRPERAGAVMAGDGGFYNPFQFTQLGWPIQPWQPPHPRPEKAGAIIRGDDGTQNTFQFTTTQVPWWEFNQFYPRQAWEKRGAILRGDDGIAAPFRRFFDYGWFVQPWQPPRRRWERAGGLFGGDPGHHGPFIRFFNHGWPVQPWQPPHPRPERAGAIMRGDDGTHARFISFVNPGWPVQPWQPPHPRPERAGAIMFGDDGIEALFQYIVQFIPMGWEVQPWQPPRPRWERSGGVMPFPFIDVPMPVPPIPPIVIDTQGRFIALDSVNGIVAASRVRIGEAFNFLMAVGGDIPDGDLMLVITKPDGTVRYVRSSRLFIGEVPISAFIGDFAPQKYVAYTFAPGEADMAGQWAVYLQAGIYAYKQMYFLIYRP